MSDLREYIEDQITTDEFDSVYQQIKSRLIKDKPTKEDRCTIVLGGQPGAGKSSFYKKLDDLESYVVINGDDYRKNHPRYEQIINADPEHYSERTQRFIGKVIGALIEDLSNNGYNLVIEGTLRDPSVPIKTCKQVQAKGYKTDLVIVACDAETSWKSTLQRAEEMQMANEFSRFVPIDVFDYIVTHLPEHLDIVEKEGCFDRISIVNRDGEVLYPADSSISAKDVIAKEINIDNWESKRQKYEQEFLQKKIEILQKRLNKKSKSYSDDIAG